VKSIPDQVREAMQEVARLAKARGDEVAAYNLSSAAFLLDGEDLVKLRNLLR